MRVTVWVDSWQYQCCGDAFGVGDTVSWRLGGSGDDWLVTILGDRVPPSVGFLPVLGHLDGDESGGAGVVVGAGGLRVSIRDDDSSPAPDVERRVDLLCEDRHIDVPQDAPTTEAVVRRVRLIRVGYHDDPAQRARVITPGSGTIQDVDPAPKWPEQKIDGLDFTGFLVDLDVADVN